VLRSHIKGFFAGFSGEDPSKSAADDAPLAVAAPGVNIMPSAHNAWSSLPASAIFQTASFPCHGFTCAMPRQNISVTLFCMKLRMRLSGHVMGMMRFGGKRHAKLAVQRRAVIHCHLRGRVGSCAVPTGVLKLNATAANLGWSARLAKGQWCLTRLIALQRHEIYR
jgi:hypothetical protein